MKKNIIIMLCGLVFLLSACNMSQKSTDETPDVDTTQTVTDASQEQQEQQPQEEQAMEDDNNTQEVADEDVEMDSGLDASLSGYDLLQSIDVTANEKLYIEATTQAEGMEYVTKMTLYEESMRVETEDEQGLNLMIYNSSEGATYMYNTLSGQGMVYYDDNSELFDTDVWNDDEQMNFDVDFEASYFEDIEGLTKAEVTTLDGMEVLYMEIVMEMGEEDYVSKEWISTKYWYPLKTEVYFGDTLTSTYYVTTITDDFVVDETTFSPPKDIEFMDVNQLYEQYDLEDSEGVG